MQFYNLYFHVVVSDRHSATEQLAQPVDSVDTVESVNTPFGGVEQVVSTVLYRDGNALICARDM
jgi:hypothetical protein